MFDSQQKRMHYSRSKMDIYSGRYYLINKNLLANFGLWPYESYKKKLILRIFVSIIMVLIILPQTLRVYLYFGVNVDILIEHIAVLLYIAASYLKFLTSIFSENKLKTVYENVANNWKMIKDKHERNILNEYSERGRILTIGYIIYMYSALVAFCTLPLTPSILNAIKPLNTSRPHIFVLGGEFFVDRDAHYREIYIFDCISCALSAFIIIAVDSMYVSSIEHCLGLFAIIKFRLQEATKLITKGPESYNQLNKNVTYEYIVQTIELHKKVIIFTDILESSYSSSFFILMGINMLILSFESVLILIKLDQIMEFIRFSFVLFGIIIHLFYLSWPGQKLITCSIGLFQDAYLNEWYKISLKAQKLLGFMTLRCSRPCQLTAGGLYVMNFANFASVVKTSLSYMTLFASLR